MEGSSIKGMSSDSSCMSLFSKSLEFSPRVAQKQELRRLGSLPPADAHTIGSDRRRMGQGIKHGSWRQTGHLGS